MLYAYLIFDLHKPVYGERWQKHLASLNINRMPFAILKSMQIFSIKDIRYTLKGKKIVVTFSVFVILLFLI